LKINDDKYIEKAETNVFLCIIISLMALVSKFYYI